MGLPRYSMIYFRAAASVAGRQCLRSARTPPATRYGHPPPLRGRTNCTAQATVAPKFFVAPCSYFQYFLRQGGGGGGAMLGEGCPQGCCHYENGRLGQLGAPNNTASSPSYFCDAQIRFFWLCCCAAILVMQLHHSVHFENLRTKLGISLGVCLLASCAIFSAS